MGPSASCFLLTIAIPGSEVCNIYVYEALVDILPVQLRALKVRQQKLTCMLPTSGLAAPVPLFSLCARSEHADVYIISKIA